MLALLVNNAHFFNENQSHVERNRNNLGSKEDIYGS